MPNRQTIGARAIGPGAYLFEKSGREERAMLRVLLKLEDLRVILAKRNMSQNMLAMKAGISSGYFSQIMHGERRPSPRLRQRLLDTLEGVAFDDLFSIEQVSDAVPVPEGRDEG
ncbi:MAG: helix-turn-helix transcriptional regulator [Chloroflexota bacterium]|nr:helix-turn-helix transcriptional regulator [Chloroflexota bacterium]